MIDTVNQCLLSQSDFDFINKANLLAGISEKMRSIESILQVTLLFAGASIVAMIMILTLAFRIRHRDKTGSNFLFAIIVIGLMVIGFVFDTKYDEFELIQSEVAVLNKDLKSMTLPDAEIFEVCSQSNAILELAPNRDDPDFKSFYKPVINVE